VRRGAELAVAAATWLAWTAVAGAQEHRPIPPPPADLSPGIPVPITKPKAPATTPGAPAGRPSSAMKTLPFAPPASTPSPVPEGPAGDPRLPAVGVPAD
jgi:hypothetical protein